jgi:hypothetical protein
LYFRRRRKRGCIGYWSRLGRISIKRGHNEDDHCVLVL